MNDAVLKMITGLDEYLLFCLPLGFLGYKIFRLGYDGKDRATTVNYGSFIFAMAAYLGVLFAQLFGELANDFQGVAFRLFFALVITLSLAIFSKKFLVPCFLNKMRLLRLTNASEHENSWQEFIHNTNCTFSGVRVTLKNGDKYYCNNIHTYANAPIQRFITDNEGNIFMYVDEIISNEGEEDRVGAHEPAKEKEDTEYFYLTYIPKSEIETVRFATHKPLK